MKKSELTLRVGNEAVHFNLNKSMAHIDADEENCMVVEKLSPVSLELNSNCNIQHSINENEMNF